MNDLSLTDLLKQADLAAPAAVPETAAIELAVRTALRRRRTARWAAMAAALVVLAVAAGVRTVQVHSDARIAEVERRVRELNEQSQATLAMVQEVLEGQRRQERLVRLHEELDSMPDVHAQMEADIDRSAFVLLYQADQMYRELNLKETAVEGYRRLIELFPQNRWAQIARERLEEIDKRQKTVDKKGDVS